MTASVERSAFVAAPSVCLLAGVGYLLAVRHRCPRAAGLTLAGLGLRLSYHVAAWSGGSGDAAEWLFGTGPAASVLVWFETAVVTLANGLLVAAVLVGRPPADDGRA